MKEKITFCPGCGGELKKWQAARECQTCGARWFILQTHRPTRDTTMDKIRKIKRLLS
jgi:hypothetical protein